MEIFRPEDVPAEKPESMPGVKIRWVIDQKRGAENFSMRVFEVDPGAAPPLHNHWYEQEMYLVDGQGVMVGDEGEKPRTPAPGIGGAAYAGDGISHTMP